MSASTKSDIRRAIITYIWTRFLEERPHVCQNAL